MAKRDRRVLLKRNPTMDDEIFVHDSAGKSWAIPMPPHVRVEIRACAGMDLLRKTLTSLENSRAAAADTLTVMQCDRSTANILAQWADAQRMMDASIFAVDDAGKLLIAAVSKMLAV
jgi:hypothetical protein